MLSRQRRLRAKEVEEVLSVGKTVRLSAQTGGSHLSMKFLQKQEPLRLAVVVPKSLARRATLRNTLRRAAYDSFPVDLSSRTGLAIFFVRSIPTESLRPVFKKEVTALLAKI